MRSPVSVINKAVYDRLKEKVSQPGYDAVPSGQKMPYWALAETTARPWGAKTIPGAEVLATVKAFSNYQGDKEVAGMANEIIAAVTDTPLTLTDDWKIVLRVIVEQHVVERTEAYREATIQFKFRICDVKE